MQGMEQKRLINNSLLLVTVCNSMPCATRPGGVQSLNYNHPMWLPHDVSPSRLVRRPSAGRAETSKQVLILQANDVNTIYRHLQMSEAKPDQADDTETRAPRQVLSQSAKQMGVLRGRG